MALKSDLSTTKPTTSDRDSILLTGFIPFSFQKLVLPRNQWNVGRGRVSVPRASGPVSGTESQCFSFGERVALERFDAHPLEWLAGTLALPRPKFAPGYFGSFLFFVLLPLVSWKNPKILPWESDVALARIHRANLKHQKD